MLVGVPTWYHRTRGDPPLLDKMINSCKTNTLSTNLILWSSDFMMRMFWNLIWETQRVFHVKMCIVNLTLDEKSEPCFNIKTIRFYLGMGFPIIQMRCHLYIEIFMMGIPKLVNGILIWTCPPVSFGLVFREYRVSWSCFVTNTPLIMNPKSSLSISSYQ